MANRLSLRLMKLLVDFTYYALPVISWLFKAALFLLAAAVIFVATVIIL